MSPAVQDEAQCFAVRRGEVERRWDVYFFRPDFMNAIHVLLNLPHEVVPLAQLTKRPGQIQNFGAYSLCNFITFVSSGIPYVKVENYTEHGIDWDSVQHITPQVHDMLPKSKMRRGDVLLSMAGTIGVSTVFTGDFEANSNQAIAKIRLNDPRLTPQFLSEFLNSRLGYLQSLRISNGGVQLNINLGEIGTILIPLPSLATQRAFVAEMEAARAARQAKLTQADALLAGIDGYVLEQLGISAPNRVSKAAFAVKLVQLRGARLDALSARSNSSFSSLAIPTRPLGDIADVDQNVVARPEKLDTLVPYVGLPECDLTSVREVVTRPYSEVKGRSIVRRGDILFARIEPSIYNQKYVLAEDLSGYDLAFTSTEFYVVRAKPEIVLQDYLYTIFFCSFVYDQAVGKTTGSSGRRRLDRDAFTALQIPLPSLAEQQTIAAEVARRRETARRLRAEAAAEWEAAKARFERALLGGAKA